MKKAMSFLIVIVLAGQLDAQLVRPLREGQLSKQQQAVQQTVIKMFDALSNRDSVSLKNYCTSDIALYEYGHVWNIDTLILKAITKNQAADFKRTNSFDFITTTSDKNTAWVTYHLNSSITREGKQAAVQWLETVVLIKERKQWKVKHLHSTLIKRS
jgi:ketosteroid isomerase-like protein